MITNELKDELQAACHSLDANDHDRIVDILKQVKKDAPMLYARTIEKVWAVLSAAGRWDDEMKDNLGKDLDEMPFSAYFEIAISMLTIWPE